jgi:hypothetical protein
MRAILKAHNIIDRKVWVADSFEGLPVPDTTDYPDDVAFTNWEGSISVSLEDVRRHFELYDLLDEQVCFLKGWFKDTLPVAPIEKLAVMRLDGDYYQSTIEALTCLYPKLSIGGYLLLDDYLVLPPCRKAIDEFRAKEGIKDELIDIDGTAVYWRRS